MIDRLGIVAGGNWIVDRLKLVDVYPREESLANILFETIGNGGSPFNVLVDLAKLGAPFPLFGVGQIGEDADGRWIAELCNAHDIDASQLKRNQAVPTSYTDVMTVRGTGKRTFFHQRGANAYLDDQDFDFARSSARHLHLGYLLLLDRLDEPDAIFGTRAARVLHRAHEAGMTTSVDLVSEDSHRFGSVITPSLGHVDYCIMNECELERLTGREVRSGSSIDMHSLRAGALEVLDLGVRQWIVVHFPEGAVALGADASFYHQASLGVPQAEIVSAVGAGDAFAAGVLFALHECESIGTALRYGVCSAAACLLGNSASDGMRPLAECLELQQRFGQNGVVSTNCA